VTVATRTRTPDKSCRSSSTKPSSLRTARTSTGTDSCPYSRFRGLSGTLSATSQPHQENLQWRPTSPEVVIRVRRAGATSELFEMHAIVPSHGERGSASLLVGIWGYAPSGASAPSVMQATVVGGHKFMAVRRLSRRLLDLSKNAIFTHSTCILRPRLVSPFKFRQHLWHQKTESVGFWAALFA